MSRLTWLGLALTGAIVVLLYAGGYLVLRLSTVETWERDGHEYVLVPTDHVWLYYVYRPVMIVDGAATGMRFHIGPHRE